MGFLRIMPLAATLWLYSAAVLSASVETFNTTSSACDGDNGLPFNSTGTVSFTPSEAGFGDTDPWYITAGLKDSRPANYSDYKGTQSVYFFLSVPQEFVNSQDANRTSYCIYQFDPKDTTTSKDDGSCDGLFSDACTKAIEKFQKTVSPANGECPQFPIKDHKECKGPGVIIHSDYIAGDSCLPNPLPGVTGVPENYATRGSFGLGLITGDTEIDSFDAYDRHVRQTYAMIVVVGYELDRSNDDIKYFGSDSKLRCLRPNHIVEGSRDPDSSAELLRVSWASIWGAVVVTIAIAFVS